MTDVTHGWWVRGDELSVTACGRKIGDGQETPLLTVTWVEKYVTCEACLETLRAAGLAAYKPVGHDLQG